MQRGKRTPPRASTTVFTTGAACLATWSTFSDTFCPTSAAALLPLATSSCSVVSRELRDSPDRRDDLRSSDERELRELDGRSEDILAE